jgi:hypothetical protein
VRPVLILVAEFASFLAGHDDDQRHLARREDAALPLQLDRAVPLVAARSGGRHVSHLLAEGVLDHDDISPETLFSWVQKSAVDAVEALISLIETSLGLVTAVGELAPVNEVYRAPGLPGIYTTRPEPGQAGA